MLVILVSLARLLLYAVYLESREDVLRLEKRQCQSDRVKSVHAELEYIWGLMSKSLRITAG